MKKLIFIGVLGLFALGSCNSKKTGHEGHDHETVTHNHDEHEGHEHETEGHDHEAEGADHSHEGECSGGHDHDKDAGKSSKAAGEHSEPAGEHSDEIILPKAKADAAGVKVSTITPAPFQQVIKTSGQVLAAQGDESVAVATVAGVVSFRGKVTEGMSVGRGTPLITISSHNIADGDPVQRARIAYEVSKKEYERMKSLVKNKIVSDKDFAQAEQNYENARLSYEALAKNHSAIGQNITAPIAGYHAVKRSNQCSMFHLSFRQFILGFRLLITTFYFGYFHRFDRNFIKIVRRIPLSDQYVFQFQFGFQ